MTDEPRTRQPRAEEMAQRRRRADQKSVDPSVRRFGVTDDFFDHDRFVYRAAVDDGSRLIQLTQADDYDFVTAKGEKASGPDQNGVLRYRSGTIDGQPQYTYLLRKPIEFAAEDRRAKDEKIDELEKARVNPDDAPDKSYKPKSGRA